MEKQLRKAGYIEPQNDTSSGTPVVQEPYNYNG